MQQLRFVGVHDDGQHLILESPDGQEQFQVVLDAPLRDAVVKARRAHPARGLSGNGVFGPRDIQTRFRQGATVDEIVAESGWKPERVRRYEWPILAERSHIVTAAQAVAVSPRPGREGRRRSLHDQVVAVREEWGFAEGDAQWNSWQREDGQWNVSVSVDYSQQALARIPRGSDFPARFVYNPANQTVAPGNAVAEFLLDRAPHEDAAAPAGEAENEDAVETSLPEEAAEGTARSGLQALPEDPRDDQDELLTELDSRRGTPAGSDPASDARLEELAERVRHGGPETAPAPAPDSAESVPEDAAEGDDPTGSGSPAGSGPTVAEKEGQEGSPEAPTEDRPGTKASKRPSVPSWDDIVFGNRR